MLCSSAGPAKGAHSPVVLLGGSWWEGRTDCSVNIVMSFEHPLVKNERDYQMGGCEGENGGYDYKTLLEKVIFSARF